MRVFKIKDTGKYYDVIGDILCKKRDVDRLAGEEDDSSVYGMITTDGLFEGKIQTSSDQYIVERSRRYFKDASQPPSFHSIIYRLSSVHMDRLNATLCRSRQLHQRLLHSQRQETLLSRPRLRRSWRSAEIYTDPGGRYDSGVDPFRERYAYHPPMHRPIDPLKTTCTMYIQADHLFFEKFDSNEDMVVEQLTQHVQGVNDIYRKIGEI